MEYQRIIVFSFQELHLGALPAVDGLGRVDYSGKYIWIIFLKNIQVALFGHSHFLVLQGVPLLEGSDLPEVLLTLTWVS